MIDWLHDFQPDKALRQFVLDTIQTQTGTHPGDEAERRNALTGQLERLRDLYVMGDLTKSEYVMRRQALEEELQRTKPPTNPDLDSARAILEDFARFWDAEPEPAERRKLVLSLFEQVWQKDGQIVAANPTTPSPTTSPPRRRCGPRTQKPTRGMRQQIRERRGSNPRPAPPIEIRVRNGSTHGQSRLAES